MKRILVTGTGSSGSWRIRGEQLGHAIGADVIPLAKSVAGYDLVVVVKRGEAELFDLIRRSGVLMVWDVVDAWPQPYGNLWDMPRAMEWLKKCLESINPFAVAAPTITMSIDVKHVLQHERVQVIDHHARPGQTVNPIREEIKVVGYEGSEQYMRAIGPRIASICESMGFRFVMNPTKLCELDVVIAMRDDRGYPVRHWKSNVKLANAQATGTPCILDDDYGYRFKASGAEFFLDDVNQLHSVLETLRPYEARKHRSDMMLKTDNSLDTVAKTYLSWLESL